MKRKLLAILTSALLLCAMLPLGAIPVAAATSGTTGDCTWTLVDGHLTISGEGKMEDYYFWDSATAAPWGWRITSLTIEEGVTSIGEQAFYYSDRLTSVTISNSVTTIAAEAFSLCFALTSIVLPNSVTNIGFSAFNSCDSLTDVYYGGFRSDRDTIAIGTGNDSLLYAMWHYTPCPKDEHVYAFPCDEWCNRCEQLRTPEAAHTGDASCTVCGKTFLEYEIIDGEVAITGCSNDLKGHYVIPDTIEGYPVTALWEGAFYGCYITGLTLPAHLREFSPWAIYSIPTIETIEVSDDNPYFCVMDEALYSKDMTSLVYIPSAKGITSYTVPNGVTEIESMVFSNFKVETIYIPKSVTYIGDGNLGHNTVIYYGGSEEEWENVSIDWMFNGDGGNEMHYNWEPEPEVTYGDPNGDGRINNRDMGILQQYLADWDVELKLDACDVNKDGKVNNRDLGLLQQYLADWDVVLG